MSVWIRHEDGGSPYSGFWRRVAALIVDFLVLAPVVYAMMFLMFGLNLSAFAALIAGRVMSSPAIAAWYFGVASAIWLFYYMIFESSAWQATLGKLLLGIKVTDMSGGQINMLRAAFRSWPLWADGILYVFVAGGDYVAVGHLGALVSAGACIVVAFTQNKQGLHDIMAGTLIVRRGAVFEDSDAIQ